MKYYLLRLGLFSILATMFIACGEDEPDLPDPPVVSAQDLTIEVSENAELGLLLGTVSGTSNQGAVTFSIASQSPSGAVAIDATSGDLTVADATAFDFDINPVITATVDVTRTTVTQTANVTINLIESLNCPSADLSALVGELNIRDLGFQGNPGIGAYDGCGTFTITSDILGFLCGESEFTLMVEDSTETLAKVTMERQPYLCGEEFDYELEGSGVYDIEEELLTLVYDFYDSGELFYPGTFRIANTVCHVPQDLSAWNGPISIEDVGGETTSTTAFVDCDQIQLETPNIENMTCDDIGTLNLYIAKDGSIDLFKSIWWCNEEFFYYMGQGSYNEATQEVNMTYTILDLDEVVLKEGELIIKPQ